MSFARNFALGQQIAKTAMDTYDQARQQKEFADIQNAKPEEFSGYTAQDGDQLAAIANARDPQGNPYYTLEAQPGGQYGIRSNFQVQGADGQMTTPAQVGIGQRRVSNFLGQRYDAEQLTPERMEGLRARAMAGAVSKTDPIRGMGLMQSIKSGERDDTRFDWEKQGQPLKQRAAELQIAGAERGERQGVRTDRVQAVMDQGAKMTDDEVADMFPQLNSRALAGLPIYDAGDVIGPDGKPTGFRTVRVAGPDGKSKLIDLSPAQQRSMVNGYLLQKEGFGAEALAQLSSAGKDIADTVDRYNRTVATTTTSSNEAAKGVEAGRHNRASERIAATTAGAAVANANTNAAFRASQQIQPLGLADDGKNLVFRDGDKVYSKPLPEGTGGLFPKVTGNKAGRAVDPKDYSVTVKNFTEAGMPLRQAQMLADQHYGLSAPTNDVAAQLKALSDAKAKGVSSPASAPAAAAPQLGIAQRLGNAVGADNSAGNRNQFNTLAAEAEQNYPAYIQQIETLQRAIPSARSQGERANLENRINQLRADAQMYQSILQQRAAQRGY